MVLLKVWHMWFIDCQLSGSLIMGSLIFATVCYCDQITEDMGVVPRTGRYILARMTAQTDGIV